MVAAPLFALVVIVVTIVLAIIAFVRSERIAGLERRVMDLEAAIRRLVRERTDVAKPETAPRPAAAPGPTRSPARPQLPRATPRPARNWEALIGKHWLGWTGISVLVLGCGFGLKFAFENRWIGDLGRVLLGLAGGVGLSVVGHYQLRLGRRGFAQALTAGGVTLLYLSVYASYGFYQLIAPTPAFVLLAAIVLQAHLFAAFQNAPGIAIMGQIGGFLAPVLLSTGEDRLWILFSFVLLLDAGAILVAALRRWHWISSVSFLLTHLTFWAWQDGHFTPEKLWPAMAFLLAALAMFVFADLERLRRGQALGIENWIRLLANPLAFFGAAYSLLEPQYPEWMGAFALVVALIYAGLAKSIRDPRTALALAGIAGMFVALAIPIQLDGHWVTLAWALQASVLSWLAARDGSASLRRAALLVFSCALVHYLGWDVQWSFREAFTPLLNRDFATAATLFACLGFAALLLHRKRPRFAIGLGLCAWTVLWLASTIEAYSYFDVLVREASAEASEVRTALRWSGQLSISLVWTLFAAALVGGGMLGKVPALRWSGLVLFCLTALKVLLVDVGTLAGAYRVVALLALGSLLVVAAWAYQRRSRDTSS